MEVAFFGLVTYAVVETLALPMTVMRGRRIGRVRGTIYGLVLAATFVVGWLLYAKTGTVIT